ncbi:MAG: ATP-binding protein [Bacteroidales bacterium]|nr:ATP-binding protein [Bacteroidales bacterium]
MLDKTKFAPALRSSSDQILKENRVVTSQKLFGEILEAINGKSTVIDNNRQIIYANNDFINFLGLKNMDPILGLRLGEVISCIHSGEEPFGCGTSAACAYCGAVNAILESQKSDSKSTKECRITTVVDEKLKSWDLNITSSPISLAGNLYYIISIQDISHKKRRSALEKTFFHDLLNSAGGLNGLLTILKDGISPEEAPELINLSEEASRDILDEIMIHMQIRAAENGDLNVKIEPVNSVELLVSSVKKISSHEVGQNKEVIISENSANINFETDRILLQRVIINLIKNALEATPQRGTIFVGLKDNGDKIIIWVKNSEVIPMDVQLQLFQRSYSTKGHNRGIGTYSIKLLTENYLKGKVSFLSNETDRTIFSIELNKVFECFARV